MSIWEIVAYVSNGSGFWGSMGFATATAMIIGALLYDGRSYDLKKGVITIFTYSFFIFITIFSRILPVLPRVAEKNIPQAFASLTTILLVTLFYLLGLVLGVTVFRMPKK